MLLKIWVLLLAGLTNHVLGDKFKSLDEAIEILGELATENLLIDPRDPEKYDTSADEPGDSLEKRDNADDTIVTPHRAHAASGGNQDTRSRRSLSEDLATLDTKISAYNAFARKAHPGIVGKKPSADPSDNWVFVETPEGVVAKEIKGSRLAAYNALRGGDNRLAAYDGLRKGNNRLAAYDGLRKGNNRLAAYDGLRRGENRLAAYDSLRKGNNRLAAYDGLRRGENRLAAYDALNKLAPPDAINKVTPQDALNKVTPQDALNKAAPHDALNTPAPHDALNEVAPHVAQNKK